MCIEAGNDYFYSLLNEAKFVPVDNEIDPDKITFPPWYNEQLFKKGQKFYTRNIFAMFVGMLCGLIAVLAVPSILNVLMCTKRSSTPATAYRRYIRTIFHIVTWHWYSFDTNNKSSESRAWKSILSVRRTHLTASKYCSNTKNIFISQRDMALTQFGFMGFVTLRPDLFGLNNSNDEFLQSTIHYWRVIGYMLGIKDEYNLCTDNCLTTKERLKVVMENIYRPGLTSNDNNFIEMTTALISGLWSFNPFLSIDTYLYFTRRLAGCNGYEYLKSDYKNVEDEKKSHKLYKNLKNYNRFTLYMLVYVLQTLYKYQIIKWYFNLQIYLSLFLIYWFPFLAYHRFGFKKSYVRI